MTTTTSRTAVFIGDSVTAADRSGKPADLGIGYVARLASPLRHLGFTAVNRGVNGDRIRDLGARLAEDCLALEPELVSIAIGINDVLADDGPDNNALDHDAAAARGDQALAEVSASYKALLDEVRGGRPGARLVLVGPFLLPATQEQEAAVPLLARVQEAIAELAAQHDALHVDTQSMMVRHAAEYGREKITTDGIHPTGEGHRVLATTWWHAVVPALGAAPRAAASSEAASV